MAIYSLMQQGHLALCVLCDYFSSSAFRLTSMVSARRYTADHAHFRLQKDYA